MRHLQHAFALTLALLAFKATAALDHSLLAAAQAEQAPVMDTLRTLVTMESGTMDAPGLARMTDHLQDRLVALGARLERRKANGVNGDVLIGRYSGSGKRRIMLIAHMDTIYHPGTLAREPIKLEGNRLYGPGIADDKGGIAAHDNYF